MTAVADIGQWFADVASRYPTRVAVVDGDEVLTFGALLTQADRLAAALAGMGLGTDSRVGLLARNSHGFVVAYLALARLGACAVLLNARWTSSELAYALRDTDAGALVYDEDLSATVGAAIRETAVRALISTGGQPGLGGSVSMAALLARASAALAIRRPPDPDRPLMILHTSGTTGFPKGAVLSHGNVAWATFGIIHDNGYAFAPGGRPGSATPPRCLVSLPLYHVAGLQLQMLPHLLSGGSVVLTRASDPIEVVEEARRTGASSTYLLRFQWRRLAEAVLAGRYPGHASKPLRLRQMILGGGRVDPEVFALADRLGAELTFTMGMTEAGPQIFRMSGDELRRHNGSLGRCRWYVRAAVVGEDGRPLPAGEVGELIVRGPTVTRGYLREPASAESAIRDGWYYTGDLVVRRDDGLFVYVDRKKDMIRTGGENVYAVEVERVLGSIPEVAEAAVVGVPDPKWGEMVKAFVVLKPGRTTTGEAIVERTRAHLAGYKCPRVVQFLDALPRTSLGRVKKADLRGQ